MNNFFNQIREFIESSVGSEHLDSALRIAFLLVVGLPVVWILSRLLGKLSKQRFGEHLGIFFRKAIFYVGLILILIHILMEFGFNPAALLGAAGILSVAIGFASQTSLSNIISGIFLYWEQPFTVGDIIKVGDTSGIVLSIDLMSVKMRQFDNHFVRIPNETMIKTQVTNVTKFPIRRVDVEVGTSYGSDVEHVMKVLRSVADQNPFCMDEPNPLVVFKGFGDSSLNFMVGAWCEKTQFLDLKNSLTRDVKNAFDLEGIEIPFPQRGVYVHTVAEKENSAESNSPDIPT